MLGSPRNGKKQTLGRDCHIIVKWRVKSKERAQNLRSSEAEKKTAIAESYHSIESERCKPGTGVRENVESILFSNVCSLSFYYQLLGSKGSTHNVMHGT